LLDIVVLLKHGLHKYYSQCETETNIT